MTFVDAIIAIAARPDVDLCDDETELSGERASICVYQRGVFVGKLRWPRDGRPATVDSGVESVLIVTASDDEFARLLQAGK